ncbi:MAG: hypothetical protein ABWY56_15030 [Propionibacteriaceae bacterium]
MRPTQTRRLLVFVVCALGVTALYVVPALSPRPRVAERATPSHPTSAASGVAGHAVSRPATAAPVAQPTVRIQQTSDRARTSDSTTDTRGSTSQPRRPQPPASTRPAGDGHRRDRAQPAAVASVQVEDVTSETVTVRWAPAHDNVAVVSYQVWLNGFQVASTSELSATVDWFNDDMGQHVVQVRAVDAAGNESATSRSVLVTRPSAPPTGTPPTPDPTGTATAPAATESADSPEPTIDDTPQPSTGSRPDSQPTESDPTEHP